MLNRQDSEKVEKVFLVNLLMFLAIGSIIFISSIYRKTREHLKKRAALKNSRIPKSITHPIRSTSHDVKVNKVSSKLAAITRGTLFTQMVTDESEPKNKSENPKTASKKDKKTSLIQRLIGQHRRDKKNREQQGEQQAAKEKAEEKRQHKEAWEEAQKLTRQLEVQQSDNEQEDEKAPIVENTSPVQKKSIFYEANKNIRNHAKFLLEFSYQSDGNAPSKTDELIKTLVFIFHYHRYNLARRLLLTNEQDENLQRAVNLRTLIVHKANKILLEPLVILNTQNQMRTFLPSEVAHLSQRYSLGYVKSDNHFTDLVKLAGHSVNEFTFNSMESTPLYCAFINNAEQINAHEIVNDNDFYHWMKYQVIPFLNLLETQTNSASDNSSLSTHITKEEYFAAMKMMIIILGEYCTEDRCSRLNRNHSKIIEPETLNFMKLCRKLRNDLAHDILDVTEKQLLELLRLAKKVFCTLPETMPTTNILLPTSSDITDSINPGEKDSNYSDAVNTPFNLFTAPLQSTNSINNYKSRLNPNAAPFIPKIRNCSAPQ